MVRTDAKRKKVVIALIMQSFSKTEKDTLTFVVQILITWRISNLCRTITMDNVK